MPDAFNLSNVFVSYSRKDTVFVRGLDAAFKARKMEVWVDWEDIPLSANWWEEIKVGIEGADVFIFVISPDSVASDICRQEITHAIHNNKRFIPILHREINTAELRDKMHPAISAHNWVFLRETDDFDKAFAQLLQVIRADFEYMQLHTRLLVRAREWEANGYNDSYALTGMELERAVRWLGTAEGKDPHLLDLHTYYVEFSRDTYQRRRLRFFAVTIA